MRIPPFLFALALSACGLAPLNPGAKDTGDTGQPATGFQVPETLDFGNVPIGDSASDAILVRNHTDAEVGLFAGALSGDSAFWLDSATSFPMSVPAGGEATITLGFAPTAEQAYAGELSITVQGETEPTVVSIVGRGGDAGGDDSGGGSGDDGGSDDGLTTDLSSIDFGSVYTNADATETLTIMNSGSYDVLVTGLTFSDPSVLSWAPAAGQNFNLAQVITAGSSKQVDITFDPADERAYNETLTIESDDGNKVVQIRGTGAEPPCAVCTPTIAVTTNGADAHTMSLFGSVFGLSVTEAMTIRNESDVDLELIDFTLVNDTQGGTFSISGFTPQTLGPRAQMSGSITYTCPDICVEVAIFGVNTLTISSDDPAQASYEVGLTTLPP